MRPGSVIGRNTVTSLQSGAVNGYVGAVRNIVSLMKREMGGDVRVVATGGLAKLVGDETDIFLAIDRSLMLDGLYLLYESYQKKQGRMAP